MRSRLAVLFLTLAWTAGIPLNAAVPATSGGSATASQEIVVRAVSGTAVHYFSSVIVHSQEPTPTGMIQRSTDTVELSGDLKGRVLYHPVTVFDFAEGTMVNTGHQVFSGTVLGSAPVLLFDDEFRFDLDLATGAHSGEVHLSDNLAGPKIRCDLNVVGTGLDANGNGLVSYTGECRFKRSDLPGMPFSN